MGKKRDGYVDIWSSSDHGGRKKPKKQKQSKKKQVRSQSPQKHTKAKKPHRVRRCILVILLALVLIITSLLTAGYFYIGSSLNTVDFPMDKESLGIDSSAQSSLFVKNIALFGVDSRGSDDSGRSDTMMIVSLDGKHHEIKLTSVLRDSRVEIPGHGMDKLCHAYAYGGPELAVETLNENYHLDIDEYITVNFNQLAQIIDAIGGVTIDITEKERVAANGLIASTPSLSYSPEIKTSGTVHLNGAQAVAYSRIRKIDNESERASRQQTVLQAMLNQISSVSVLEYPKLVKEILPYLETSISYGDLVSFLPFFLFGIPDLTNNTVPDQNDPNVKGGEINGVWYWSYDLDDAADSMHEFIYNQS